MGLGVDILELADADFGVHLGRVQVAVAEHLLDVTDVGPVFQHLRGQGVPEDVATAGLGDLGLAQVALDQLAQGDDVDSVAVAAQEQRRFSVFAAEPGADFY